MLTRVLVCLDLVLDFLLVALFLSTPLTSPPRIHHDPSLCFVRFFHTSMSPEELARIEYVLEYELGFRMDAHRPPPTLPVPPKPKPKKPPLPPKYSKFVSKDMIPLLPMPPMPRGHLRLRRFLDRLAITRCWIRLFILTKLK